MKHQIPVVIAADNVNDLEGLQRRFGQARAAQPSQPATVVQLPHGWVPLNIEYEPGYPEEVAYGPQIMMDRLKKWLERYFALRAASQAHPSAPAESGWQWVPREPTREMVKAAFAWSDAPTSAYRSMLKAAPSAAQPGGEST